MPFKLTMQKYYTILVGQKQPHFECSMIQVWKPYVNSINTFDWAHCKLQNTMPIKGKLMVKVCKLLCMCRIQLRIIMNETHSIENTCKIS